jgi:hypothetical protein
MALTSKMAVIKSGFEPQEMKFKCDLCPKGFLKANLLKTHVLFAHKKQLPIVWSGENRYSCPWCDRLFTDPSVIPLHVRSVHQYNCNDCLLDIPTWIEYLKHSDSCPHSRKNILYHVQKRL